MSNEIDEYFNRKSTEWNIFDFLVESNEEPFQRKIDRYLKSLETIVDCEEGKKKEKAKYLLQRYREGNQTDRQEAKRWENARRSVRSGSLFHFYNPKFEGNSLVGEGIIHQSEKRSREKNHGVVPVCIFLAIIMHLLLINYNLSSSVQKKQILNYTSKPLYTPTRSPMFKSPEDIVAIRKRNEDFYSSLLKTIISEDENEDENEDDEEKKELEELSDDEEPEIIVDENVLTFDETIQLGNSEWRLSSGELVKNVLSQKTSMVLENFKNAKLNAFTASVIRLGLSSIVDLSSEFPNGMHTWFGEEWYNLKRKVQSRINMLPMKFEGCVLESIEKIESLCLNYRYWDAREYLLDQMKDRSATTIYLQIMKIYFTIVDMLLNDPHIFIDEDGKENKLTEMEFVLKTVAPVMDIIFSDVNKIVKLRWGETVSKACTRCRKIDLRIETQEKRTELSHIECARAPTPAKIVRDRSKILRTNKCILDNYLRWNIPDQDVENSAVFAFQFAGLHGQLLAVDLLDNGLYFGLEGPAFKFPSQLSNIKTLRQTLEILYFFKERIMQKVNVLLQFDNIQTNPYKRVFNNSVDEKQPEPKHKKFKFIRSTYFTPRGRNQK